MRGRESCRRPWTHGGHLLAQRRGHPQVRRGDQRGADHCEFAGIDRRAGRGLQRHGAHLFVRMRDRRRQQHHRQRKYLSLPQHQARGPEDTEPYVVPSSQSDLLQHERGGESAPVPVALHHHCHQSASGANRPRGHCPASHLPYRLTSMSRSFPMRSPRSRSSCREWRRSISTRRTRSSRWVAGR